MTIYNLLDAEEAVTLESLSLQHRIISLESQGLSQTFSALSSKFPGFVNDVKTFISTTLNPFAPKGMLVDSRGLEKLFQKVDYVTVQPLSVFVPAGFQGYWLDYTELLQTGQGVLNRLQSDLLKPFEMWLAMTLNDPNMLRDLTAPPSLARFKAPDLEKLKKEFNRFNTGGTRTVATYGQVVKRHADIPVISRELNEVNSAFVRIDRKALIAQVTEITRLLDLLMQNVKEDPETYRLSGPNAKLLADMTYTAAEEISFYSIFGYHLESFTRAVDDSYKKLYEAIS